VEIIDAIKPKAPRKLTAAWGFSLVEMLVAIAVSVVLASIVLIRLQPALQGLAADSAMAQVKSVLRQARETSISERRDIAVVFLAPNTIQLFRFNVLPGGAGQVLSAVPFLSVPIEGPTQFLTFAGEIDTPDAFGIPPVPAGIMFAGVVGGPPSGMQFNSDGTFDNGTGTAINGTVFVGFPGTPSSARAITIMGATGRIKAYHGDPGTSWWSQ